MGCQLLPGAAHSMASPLWPGALGRTWRGRHVRTIATTTPLGPGVRKVTFLDAEASRLAQSTSSGNDAAARAEAELPSVSPSVVDASLNKAFRSVEVLGAPSLPQEVTAAAAAAAAAPDPTPASTATKPSDAGAASGNERLDLRAGAASGNERLDLRACRHSVNLTNGIEAIPVLDELGLPYSFVRIQSTACEQQNLEALMCELDANLLLSLALGHCCLVYDLGSRGRDGTPRALWYGLEFVRYTLTKLWLRRTCPAVLRGKNVARTFDGHIRSFKQSTLRRLQYYAKFIPPAADGSGGPGLERLRLYGVHRPTVHDYETAFYVDLLHRHQLGGGQPLQPSPRSAACGVGGDQQAWQAARAPTPKPPVPSMSSLGADFSNGQGRTEQQAAGNGAGRAASSRSAIDTQQLRGGAAESAWRAVASRPAGDCGAAGAGRVGVRGSLPGATGASGMNSGSGSEWQGGLDAAGPAVGPAGLENGPAARLGEQELGLQMTPRSGSGGGSVCHKSGECSEGGAGADAASWGKEGDGQRESGVLDMGDGERVLSHFGFRIFWRGLTPQEWEALAAQGRNQSDG